MNEKERKKQIKRELKQKAQDEFEKNLPMSRINFQDLFNYLDEKLSEVECDDTFKTTKEFLNNNGIKDLNKIENWLKENGGYCDCEVLYNIEEKFEDNAIL